MMIQKGIHHNRAPRRHGVRAQMLLAGLMILALLAAACGGESDTAAEGGTEPAPAQTPDSESADDADAEAEPVEEEEREPLQAVEFGVQAPAIQSLHIEVAHRQRMYEERGIAVGQVAVGAAANAIQALVSRSLRMSQATIDSAALATNEGATLVAIASQIEPPHVVVGGDGITDWEDIRGTQVGITTVTNAITAQFAAVLSEHGLEEGTDYEFVQAGNIGERMGLLRTGRISAAMIPPPASFEAAEELTVLGDSRDITPATANWIIVDSGWAEENRDLVVQMLAAQLEALDWLMDEANRDEAIEILSEYTGTSIEASTITYDFALEHNSFERARSVDSGTAGNFLEFAENAGVGTFESIETYIDPSYMEEATNS